MVAARVGQTMTVEEFARIDEDGHVDLVDGEVWHVEASGQRHGKYAIRMARHVANHVAETASGEVYGAEFAYIVEPDTATVLCPDVSYLTAEHVLPENDDFHPGPPDIAVEVISPSETARRVAIKVGRYLQAGTATVWCVYPRTRQIVVHEAETAPFILSVGDTLSGGGGAAGVRAAAGDAVRGVGRLATGQPRRGHPPCGCVGRVGAEGRSSMGSVSGGRC